MAFIVKRIYVLQRVLTIVEVLVLQPPKSSHVLLIVEVDLYFERLYLRTLAACIVERAVVCFDARLAF